MQPIKRHVQTKNKLTDSVYVSFPSNETGLNVGDVVEIEIIDKGYVVLKKMQSATPITKPPIINEMKLFIDKVLKTFGLHEHIDYEIKK